MRRRFATLLYILAPLAASSCVSEKEKPTKASNPESFEVSALPADAQKAEIDFDQKISLLGYRLTSRGTVRPGQRVSYTLYWQLNKPLASKGWGLFTHVLDTKKKRLLNIDKVGPMREAALTPNDWRPGKIYVDDQSFSVPNDATGDKVLIGVGIWKGEERLPITSGAQLGDNRALALSIPLKAADEAGDTTPPKLRVDRLPPNTVLKIDGKLDEAVWKSAAATGPFIDVRSGKAATSSAVQGSARLLWDKEALYIGFEVQDKNIVGGFSKTDVDPHLWTKDTVEMMIDPDGDGDNKDYYEIQVNPQNLVFDSQFDEYNLPKGGENGPFGHQEWSAKLTSAVSLDGSLDVSSDEDKGYTVEVKLPWSSFAKAKKTPPDLGAEWRINLYAMQDNGGVAWSPILGQGNFHKASRFGRVLFADKDWQPPSASAAASQASAPHPANAVPQANPIQAAPVQAAATQGAAHPALVATNGAGANAAAANVAAAVSNVLKMAPGIASALHKLPNLNPVLTPIVKPAQSATP